MNTPSKSAVRKAGSRLREIVRRGKDNQRFSLSDLEAVLDVIEAYREGFAAPLQSLNMSLRSYLTSLGINGEVTQRLKRMSTIIDKLTNREDGLDLSRMRDIGGCRVVTVNESTKDLYELAHYIQGKNPGTKLIDYVEEPRKSGYRALHLEVSRHERVIEIQLRTPAMHQWAETMEAFSNIFGENFKQDGETDIHRYMFLQTQIAQTLEKKETVSVELEEEFSLLSQRIRGSLREVVEQPREGKQ